MKTKKRITLFLAILMLCSIFVGPAFAEPEEKTTTDWREDYAYTLGVQAYIFSYPWVFLPNIRYAWVKGNEANSQYATYMAFNRFWKSRDILTPKWRDGGSPQNDVLYNMSILDLNKEPMVLTVPDLGDRYFTFEIASATSDNFGYVGTRTTGNKAANYVIIGPDWKGKLPDGLKSIAPSAGYQTLGDTGNPYVVSPTNTVYMLGRTSLKGKPDLEAVHNIQDQYALTPLSLWGKPDAKLPPESHDTWKPFDRKTDPLADWKTINKEMTANPPREHYAVMLEQFKTIGIGPGLDVTKMDESTKKGLARAAKDGLDLVLRIGDQGGTGPMYNGFSYPPKTMGSAGYFGDLITRAAIQVQKGIVSNDSAEATYLITAQDSELNPLNGANKYTVHFEPGKLPDVKAFWSITMYDMTNNLVENKADRWAISSNLGNYQQAKDGSLTLYVQNQSPGKEKEVNWLPAPEGKFQIVFRLYYPGKEIVAQTWEPPGFVKVK